MKNGLKSILFFSALILIVDQVIKILISDRVVLDGGFPLIKNFISITLVHNTGAAFSIFSGSRIFLIGIGVLALLFVLIFASAENNMSDFEAFTYSLLVGGILGNLTDRIVRGYVIDYLSFDFEKINFPVFNLADVCIVLSVAFFLFEMIGASAWKE